MPQASTQPLPPLAISAFTATTALGRGSAAQLDALQARRWRWPLAEPGAAGVAAWLALGNATAMDEHGAIHPLARMQWCERMRSVQRPAIGCGQ